MIKNKVLTVALAGSILIGGSSLGLASNVNAKSLAPNVDIIPISAPINGDELENTPSQTKFTDIERHWAYNEIIAITEKGIIKDLDGNFEPDTTALREDVVFSLEKIFGLKEIYNGPEQSITRIELAKAIEQSFAAKKLSVMMTLVFPVYEDTRDLPSEDTSALSFVYNTGIMKGRTQQQFAPNASITRAELAVILSRTLSTLEIAQQIEEPSNEVKKELKMEGIINEVVLDDNKITSILVESQKEDGAPYDKAVFIITPTTKIMKDNIEINSLAKGETVEVTFLDGPTTKIYPVRIEAKIINVVK